MQAEAEVVQIDIYSDERASLREKLDILNGRSTWREPRTHGGSRMDNTPHEHNLAAAMAYARKCNPNDIGPDILECLIYRRIVHGGEIATQLVRALADMSARLARTDRQVLRLAACAVIHECATGEEIERPKGVPKDIWVAASALGIRLLWASAGATLRNTAEKLYKAT